MHDGRQRGSFKFWPSISCPVLSFGPILVKLTSVERFAYFKICRIMVEIGKPGEGDPLPAQYNELISKPLQVTQYIFHTRNWPVLQSPEYYEIGRADEDEADLQYLQSEREFQVKMLEFLLRIRSDTEENEKGFNASSRSTLSTATRAKPSPLLVHDLTGRGRCAMFLAVNELITMAMRTSKFKVYKVIRFVLEIWTQHFCLLFSYTTNFCLLFSYTTNTRIV